MKKIVIARIPIKNKNALTAVYYEDGRPVECFVRPETGELSEGSIFTGIVEKTDARLDAAFVRIGKDVTGYLPLRKAKNILFAGPSRKDGLKPNDRILVQVEKAAVKTKHCVLTTDISVSGKYIVLHSVPGGKIFYSKKLPKDEVRRLAGIMTGIISEHEKAPCVTVRTLAADAGGEKIKSEYENLKKIVERITGYGIYRPAGTCLYSGSTPEADMLKRVSDDELEEAVTDSEDVYSELTEELCPLLDISPSKIRLYRDPMIDLYKLYNLSTLLSRLTSEKVNLKSGASLNIETTEAFVVIDVNSANSTKKYKNSTSFLPLNLEAADEIASQIRLRQLSGIILIDFINMDSMEEEKKLAEHFKKLTARDPVKTSFVDITKLGIMEVTREKRYRNILEQMGIV